MDEGADFTLKAGTVSALGAAVTGVAQWHDLQEMDEPRRLGTLHALLNVAATGLYATSWYLRDHDARSAGVACSTAAYGVAAVSSWIGGDLAYRLGIGVSRIAFEEPEADWTDVLAEADLAEGKLTRAEAGGVPLVLYRDAARITAITATCTHVGGPLDEGTVEDGCVVCPWHGSHFELATGQVVHGPATDDARSYETRVEGGRVLVRPAR
jgi:nitrite reductase/ring-hydroxylating ferredoxin subunit